MNATLIDSKPVAIPEMTLNMARRNMPADDFARYAAVQMYQITYWSEGLKIKAYLGLPPAESAQIPALVFNAGGTGETGALSDVTAAATVGLYASWGYVVIASQYRGRGGSEGTEEWGAGDIDDAMNALALLQTLEYVDAERIGIIGGSRGGMMALQMLMRTTIFKAAITFGAPTDFTDLAEDSYILVTAKRFLPDVAIHPEELRKRSAVFSADKLCKTTPLLVLHGSGDRRVAPGHAYKLGMALQTSQHPYKLTIYDNADHVLAGRRDESNADMRAWVDMYVKNRAPLPRVGPHGA
ncbi:MAG: alpha/beta hydrolase family protein [Candidatus Kapaibacteriota bacterium]